MERRGWNMGVSVCVERRIVSAWLLPLLYCHYYPEDSLLLCVIRPRPRLADIVTNGFCDCVIFGVEVTSGSAFRRTQIECVVLPSLRKLDRGSPNIIRLLLPFPHVEGAQPTPTFHNLKYLSCGIHRSPSSPTRLPISSPAES